MNSTAKTHTSRMNKTTNDETFEMQKHNIKKKQITKNRKKRPISKCIKPNWPNGWMQEVCWHHTPMCSISVWRPLVWSHCNGEVWPAVSVPIDPRDFLWVKWLSVVSSMWRSICSAQFYGDDKTLFGCARICSGWFKCISEPFFWEIVFWGGRLGIHQ